VAQQWKGSCLGYLFLLVLLVWAPTMMRVQRELSRWANDEAGIYIDQIPKIQITDGVVSTDVQTPYFIRNKDGSVAAIIDLTGATTSLDETSAAMLLTARTLTVKKYERETETYNLAEVKAFSFDKARAANWLATARRLAVPVLFPIFVIIGFFYRAVQALIYSVIGLMLKGQNSALEFPQVFRIAVVALTPVMLINAVAEMTRTRIPGWWIICLAIALGYLIFGIRANADNKVMAQPG
jgi:hypothetical protein